MPETVVDVHGPLPAELPNDWLPGDLIIFAVARRVGPNLWEVLMPTFSVAGRGESLAAAVQETVEMLEDYFRLCLSEGLTFNQSLRPLRGRWRLVTRALIGTLLLKLFSRDHRRAGGDHRHISDIESLRLPFGHAVC